MNKMILLLTIVLSPVMGVSLTTDDLSKEEREMWDKGQLIEKCFKGRCLVNKKAQDALDYKLDVKGRTNRWVEEFVKNNNYFFNFKSFFLIKIMNVDNLVFHGKRKAE